MAEDGSLQIIARRYLEELRGGVARETDLRSMARVTNLDTAAMLYYESVMNSRRDFEFIRMLTAIKTSTTTAEARAIHNDIEILIIPSVFSLVSRWEGLGASEVERLRAGMRALGFKTDVAQTQTGLTLEENARKIGQAIIGSSASKVILVSRGRGSMEVKLLFHVLQNDGFDLSKIIGWISVNGQLNGVRAFDLDFDGRSLFGAGRSLRRLKLEAGARLNGESLDALHAAAASRPVWSTKLPLPERVSLVQIVGVPRRDHLNSDLRVRFDLMKDLGPSDGLQLLSDSHIDSGLVVPVWGLSPSAPWSAPSALIERSALMIADFRSESGSDVSLEAATATPRRLAHLPL